jgi:hypothetical protein
LSSESPSISETEKSDTHTEDDEPVRKKSKHVKLDFSNLTHPIVIRKKKKLSSSVQKTNAFLANWAHNPKKVKRRWLESPYLPEFPESELYNIIRGCVVNFDVVFSRWYSDDVEPDCKERLGGGKIKVTHARELSKSVRSSQDWTVAYSCFAQAMHFAFPHRYDEIEDYGKFIHQKFARSEARFHPRILAFDHAIRKRVSQRRDIELTDYHLFADLYEAHCSSIGTQGTAESSSANAKRQRGTRTYKYFRIWNVAA